MKVLCNARDGNPLMDSLHRDILRQRRKVQNSLVSNLRQNVRKFQVVEDHYDGKEKRLVSEYSRKKKILNERYDLFTQRGFLTMDMTYSTILHMLGEYEREWMADLEELRVLDERMVAEVKRVEHKMRARQNDFLFFKNLYF